MLDLTPFLALCLIKVSPIVLETTSGFTSGGDSLLFQDSGRVMEPPLYLLLFRIDHLTSLVPFIMEINPQSLLKGPLYFHPNNYELFAGLFITIHLALFQKYFKAA